MYLILCTLRLLNSFFLGGGGADYFPNQFTFRLVMMFTLLLEFRSKLDKVPSGVRAIHVHYFRKIPEYYSKVGMVTIVMLRVFTTNIPH